MRHLRLLLSLPLLAACGLVPEVDTDGSSIPCLCLGDTSCVETDAGWFCAAACEAAGDCDHDHTCFLHAGACVLVCAPAGPGCPVGEACVDAGPVNICAPEMGP